MGKLKENWQLALFITVLSVVMSTIGAYWVQSAGANNAKRDSAASLDYVDKQNAKQDIRIQRNEDDIDQLNESKVDKVDLQSTNQKIDKIYEWIINNSNKK